MEFPQYVFPPGNQFAPPSFFSVPPYVPFASFPNPMYGQSPQPMFCAQPPLFRMPTVGLQIATPNEKSREKRPKSLLFPPPERAEETMSLSSGGSDTTSNAAAVKFYNQVMARINTPPTFKDEPSSSQEESPPIFDDKPSSSQEGASPVFDDYTEEKMPGSSTEGEAEHKGWLFR
jgi:hypothetical protein